MRVLIIDAFPPTSQGRQDLEDFKSVIKSSLEGPYKSFLDSIAFAVRDKLGLEDFLYDPTTEFSSRAALGSFRAIDLVFIGGDANLLPWQSSCRQLLILLKACIREHKPTFLCALGMQILCHLCAVGCEKITVFNGRGRGGALSALHAMPEHVCMNLRPCDLFLDAATGDLYRKTNEFGDFSRYKNVGLSDPAQEVTATKRQPYKAHQLDSCSRDDKAAARRSECVAEIANVRLLQHHLLRGVPREFLVPALHLWQVHDKPPPPIELIATSTRGPQLVQFGPICGTQFIVRRKYPETGKILSNWVEDMCAKLRTGQPPGFCPDTLGHEVTTAGEASKWEARLRADLKRARSNSESRVRRPNTAPNQHQNRQQVGEAQSTPPRSVQANMESQNLSINGGDMQPPDAQLRAFSRAEIRKMLHPEIDISDVEPFEPVKTIRAPVQPQNPPCRWRYYKAMQPGVKARQKRPHSSPGNVRSDGTFRTAVGKATTGDAFPNALPHYVQGTPGPFMADHMFRPESKENWQSGSFVPFANSGGWNKFQIEAEPSHEQAATKPYLVR